MAFTELDPDYQPSPPIEDLLPFVNGVPDFWLTAIQNHQNLSEMVKEQDEEALQSLVDIKLMYTGVPRKATRNTDLSTVKPGFKLSFHFLPNRFFHDSVLTKEYLYKPGSQPHAFLFHHAVGTNIRWKSPETDLTHPGGCYSASFFDFFTAPPPIEDSELYELPDDVYEDMINALEVDLQAGEDFKDDVSRSSGISDQRHSR
jgi:nucleosome assembly protein 1-like 1